jgi:hypothetical protein
MADNQDYVIFPMSSEPFELKWNPKSTKFLVTWLIAIAIVGSIILYFIPLTWAVFMLAYSVLGAVVMSRHKDKKETEKRKKAEIVKARDLTAHANNILKAVESTNAELPKHLLNANELLVAARSEYSEKAFDPFWTAVENAAIDLAQYRRDVNSLAQWSDDYCTILKGRNHTFPEFPIKPESLPNPLPVLEALRDVVRLGQTDFQFANIWEHRKTRQVLIEGFKTLGDAIENLGVRIVESIASLQASMRSGIAALVAAEIATLATVHSAARKQRKD